MAKNKQKIKALRRGRDNRVTAAALLIGYFMIGPVVYLILPLTVSHFTVYLGLAILWTVLTERRILRPEVRRAMLSTGLLFVFLLTVRLGRYDLFSGIPNVKRYMWYLYYVPMILLPLLTFRTSLFLGKSDAQRPSRYWRLLALPAGGLCAAILTNDLHGLAFRFADVSLPNAEAYTRGPFYYAAVGWIALLLTGALLNVLRHATLSLGLRSLLLPAIGPLHYLLVAVTYQPLLDLFGFTLHKYPEAFCFMIAAFWEGCIRTGLVPSNTDYEVFFSLSHISAALKDRMGERRLVSAADAGGNAADLLHRETPVSGGTLLWTEDVSDLNRLRETLAENNRRLAEETDLLAAENRLLEQRAAVASKNRIYDTIAALMEPQTAEISRLIGLAEADPAQRERALRKACLLTVYIKRSTNLMLLAEAAPLLSTRELGLCISESMDYLSQMGVAAYFSDGTALLLPAERLLAAYAAFEAVAGAEGLGGLTVSAKQEGAFYTLRLSAEADTPLPAPKAPGFTVTAEADDGVTVLTLRTATGGEKA